MTEWDVCIICWPNNPSVLKYDDLTVEHVVPEFMGGSLTCKNVCKSCNEKMGNGFEGRLAKHFIFKGMRFLHDIKGKSKIPFPLNEKYKDLNSGKSFTIGRDYSITQTPTPPTTSSKDGKLTVTVSLDKKELNKSIDILTKTASRWFERESIAFDEKDLKKLVAAELAKSEVSYARISNPEIEFETEMDLDDLKLLHVKIAYELACYEFGVDYLKDATGDALRSALFKRQILKNTPIDFPWNDHPYGDFLEDGYHWVIFSGVACGVFTFGLNSLLMYTSPSSCCEAIEPIFYRFCFRSQAVRNFSVAELNEIRHEKETRNLQ